MEIKTSVEELRKKSLFIATPMYGGVCNGTFTRSLCDLTAQATKYGISVKSFFMFNESLITRARNYCVDEFLRSDCTHMMFIDSDIGFNPRDVLAMLALQGSSSDEDDYDVITGPYPKKCISWEKVKMAVDKGFADDNPNDLGRFVGDYVFNPVHGSEIQLDKPAEVAEAGTGFMMIRRPTFEKFAEEYPDTLYKPDHARTENFDGSREINMFFQAEVDPKSKRYLSEDYWFCHKARDIDLKVWMCPWMHLSHTGSYVFDGRLDSIAAIQASPTVDRSTAKKKGKK